MYNARTRRHLLQQGLALGLAGTLRPGHAAETLDAQWRDAARQRDVPYRLRVPPTSTATPWPLLIYSHGLGGSRDGGSSWGEAWAAAGFAVLHLQHPGSDTNTLRLGMAALRQAASAEQLAARVADVRFALGEVVRLAQADMAPWQAMRLDQVGMAGHSFGAHTTLALAGQRYPVPGSLADARPRAFIAFSPSSPPPASGLSVQQAFGGITRPLLAVTGSLDADPFGSYATGDTRAAVYDGLPPGQRGLLWLNGADHTSFGGGRPAGVGVGTLVPRAAVARERQATHQALVAHVTTLWWQAQLLGDTAARAALAQPQNLGPGDRLQLG